MLAELGAKVIVRGDFSAIRLDADAIVSYCPSANIRSWSYKSGVKRAGAGSLN